MSDTAHATNLVWLLSEQSKQTTASPRRAGLSATSAGSPRDATQRTDCDGTSSVQALAWIQFDKLINERAIEPFFQPIVSLDDRRHQGYEILVRSQLVGLREPDAMFLVAAELNLADELSRVSREEGLRVNAMFAGTPHLFLNTHPVELDDLPLLERHLRQLRQGRPEQPITLEIHESAVTNPAMMRETRAMLRGLNVGLAYDDFGRGHARLNELIEVPPDYLKFDITLIKDIDKACPRRRRMVNCLVELVRELGVSPLAEGIETLAEHKACLDLGFSHGQGFLYGRPAPASTYRGL